MKHKKKSLVVVLDEGDRNILVQYMVVFYCECCPTTLYLEILARTTLPLTILMPRIYSQINNIAVVCSFFGDRNRSITAGGVFGV